MAQDDAVYIYTPSTTADAAGASSDKTNVKRHIYERRGSLNTIDGKVVPDILLDRLYRLCTGKAHYRVMSHDAGEYSGLKPVRLCLWYGPCDGTCHDRASMRQTDWPEDEERLKFLWESRFDAGLGGYLRRWFAKNWLRVAVCTLGTAGWFVQMQIAYRHHSSVKAFWCVLTGIILLLYPLIFLRRDRHEYRERQAGRSGARTPLERLLSQANFVRRDDKPN